MPVFIRGRGITGGLLEFVPANTERIRRLNIIYGIIEVLALHCIMYVLQVSVPARQVNAYISLPGNELIDNRSIIAGPADKEVQDGNYHNLLGKAETWH